MMWGTLIQLICGIINIPGMMDGNVWSFAAFGYCVGLAVSNIISFI